MILPVTLSEGIGRTVEHILTSENDHPLIAVYGWPGSGKSFFMNAAAYNLRSEGWRTVLRGSASDKQTFEQLRDYPLEGKVADFFHCGWERTDIIRNRLGFSSRDYEDPNLLARDVLGRDIDVTIGIYNPGASTAYPEGTYDFVIANMHNMDSIIEQNVALMESDKDFGMIDLLEEESIGGNAQSYKGFSCAAANFSYDLQTGQIHKFDNYAGEDTRSMKGESRFRLAVKDGWKYHVIEEEVEERLLQAQPHVQLVILESAKAYNRRHSFLNDQDL